MKKKIEKEYIEEKEHVLEKSKITDTSIRPIIVYSGGYDSTLVIYTLLTRYPLLKFIIVGFNVNYFNPYKNAAENLYREKFIDYLYNDAKIRNFSYVKIDSENFNHGYKPLDIYRGEGLAQQPYFMFMTSYFSPYEINHIFTGFHQGDCFFDFKNDFDNLVQSVSNIMGKQIHVYHPLSKINKCAVVKEIQRLGLEEFCFTCEKPNKYFSPCEKCASCMALITANKKINMTKRKNIDTDYFFFDTELFDKNT